MNRSSSLFAAATALCAALSISAGFGSFVYHSQTSHEQVAVAPYLMLSGALCLALFGLLLFISGFFALRQRRLSDLAQVAWVLIMLFFPVLGALVFFLVSPGEHST